MSLPYDTALQEWGARKLQVKYPKADINRDTITVEHDYSASFGCETCGYEVTSEVNIYGYTITGEGMHLCIEGSVDFVTFIKEVVEAGEGTITSE